MNDTKLKTLLAKMLPDKTEWISDRRGLWHKDSRGCYISNVLDTELLHLASLVEAGLEGYQRTKYTMELRKIVVREMDTPPHQDLDTGTLLDIYFYGASWQQRVTALAAAKGVTL